MEEILEQMFVLVCNLISTFNTQEFTEFQQIFAKYLIQRGEILSNFEVLDFLSNIYGFIARLVYFFNLSRERNRNMPCELVELR